MATHSFILNGNPVTVDVDDDVRLLWVLRDKLGVHGPKYGCGLGVCQACTCHWNGKAINTCSVRIGDIQPTDQITTIEGIGTPSNLHPVQAAWLKWDVAECGYCQPGQIMAAIRKIQNAKAAGIAPGTPAWDAVMDGIRNVCRCATYYRIREATAEAYAHM